MSLRSVCSEPSKCRWTRDRSRATRGRSDAPPIWSSCLRSLPATACPATRCSRCFGRSSRPMLPRPTCTRRQATRGTRSETATRSSFAAAWWRSPRAPRCRPTSSASSGARTPRTAASCCPTSPTRSGLLALERGCASITWRSCARRVAGRTCCSRTPRTRRPTARSCAGAPRAATGPARRASSACFSRSSRELARSRPQRRSRCSASLREARRFAPLDPPRSSRRT